MKLFYSSLLALFAAGCLPNAQPDQIIVTGEAALEFQPEVFSINAGIRARRENQDEALAEVSERLSEIRETLSLLEGLTHLSIDAAVAEITPIHDAVCLDAADYRMEMQCPIIGYFGALSLRVEGSPAKSSGSALSLLSQLGAESVELQGYSLKDRKQAQENALDAAVKDARQRAEKIASAANASLIGPIRIQYGEGFRDTGYDGGRGTLNSPPIIVVTAQKRTVKPNIDLNLDPQPIEIEAKIVAAFEIE